LKIFEASLGDLKGTYC